MASREWQAQSLINILVVLTKTLATESGAERVIEISNCLVQIYQVKPGAAPDDITENQGQYSPKGIHSLDDPGFNFIYKHLKDRNELVSETQTSTHSPERTL